jgi:membrane protein DedA with SNARE-associated domain
MMRKDGSFHGHNIVFNSTIVTFFRMWYVFLTGRKFEPKKLEEMTLFRASAERK